MHPNFRSLRGLVVFLLLIALPSLALAADKKRKSADSDKAKAKATRKADPKQQAKASRDSGREAGKDKRGEKNKQQLAQKKKAVEEKQDKKRGKAGNQLAAKQREDEAEAKAKTAKRSDNKKADLRREKTAKRGNDKKSDKKEVAAKKSPPEKNARSLAKTNTNRAEARAKPDPKASQQEREALAQANDHKSAKRDKSLAKSEPKAEARAQAKEEPAKELPAVKFTLRPVAKITPKVELKFSVARATLPPSFDAPPPRDTGPDVIDVIEHDSPEAKRLDDLLRSEMKTLQFSGVPNTSRKKIDVGKMDEERIKQIQEVLAKKGYYTGEITGQYDEATIEAMRRFQETNRIDVTGYATAQSLRLLGLTDW
jgi:hypothetical protein